MENNENSELLKLLPYSKIASVSENGKLVVHSKNVKSITDHYTQSAKVPGNTPVILLSVIGPRYSGKSFLTNLLIQYYTWAAAASSSSKPQVKEGDVAQAQGGGGAGSWLETLPRPGNKLGGFQWNSVKVPDTMSLPIFEPMKEGNFTSGIYLWPEAFLVDTVEGPPASVWLLHFVPEDNEESGQDFAANANKMLERLLMILSSRMVEICSPKATSFTSIDAKREFDQLKATPEIFCDSISFVCYIEPDSKSQISARTVFDEKDLYALNSFRRWSIVGMKGVGKPLHNEIGQLTAEIVKTSVRSSFKSVIEDITSEFNVPIKKMAGGGLLTLGQFEKHLGFCVKTINYYFGEGHCVIC